MMKHSFDPTILTQDYRTPGERDKDKITFSQPFRALAGKAQVHSPEAHDDIRSRLTHSLEVSCVAGSLATHIAHAIGAEKIPTGLLPRDPQTIRDAAIAGALMHDIGNTPFSHPGEQAIRHFFRTNKYGQQIIEEIPETERNAFLNFHGNMQAFRIATTSGWKGSMNLTPLTLAAFCKYPSVRHSGQNRTRNKIGIFYSDRKEWEAIATNLGISPIEPQALEWHRHILSYITEAADDICYLTADLEDAATLGMIEVQTVLNFLKSLCGENRKQETATNHRSIFHKMSAEGTPVQRDRNMIRYYRSQAINRLILDCTEVAVKTQHELLMPEKYGPAASLMGQIDIKDKLNEIRDFSQKHIYDQRLVSQGEKREEETLITTQNNMKAMYNLCETVSKEILKPESGPPEIKQILEESCLDPQSNAAHKIIDMMTSLSDATATRLNKEFCENAKTKEEK